MGKIDSQAKSWRPKGLRWLVAAACLAQGGVAALFTAKGFPAVWTLAGFALLALLCLAWLSRPRGGLWEVALVSLSVGGLGMMLGAMVDAGDLSGLRPAGHPGHSPGHGPPVRAPAERVPPAPGAASVAGPTEHSRENLDTPPLGGLEDRPSTAGHQHAHGAGSHGPGMLLGWSTVSMLLLCVPACYVFCPAKNARWCHGLGAVGMLAGMAVAGQVLGPGFSALFGAFLGAHVAMTVGMAAGAAAGTGLARRFPSPLLGSG